MLYKTDNNWVRDPSEDACTSITDSTTLDELYHHLAKSLFF